MKIAYFIGTLLKEDGVTRVLIKLAREAQLRGIQSLIITGYAEDVSISPVPVIEIPSVIFPLYKAYRLSLPGIKGFEKRLDEFKPDLIHLHSPDTIAWAALKYAKRRNIPIMATYHTDFARYLSYYHISFLKPFVWFILRKLYNQLKFVTTPSPVATQDLLSHGINNARTLPWGVDFTNFSPSFRSLQWRARILGGKEKNILLCVCRLTWEKDLDTLAKTYQLLKEKRDDFSMVVAGDGPARKKLETLMPGAIFLGYIEKQELSQVYASSDILLFPSSTETFGNVTVEAMASGLVPVVADAGGSKSLVQNGKNGFLAPPKNSHDFYLKVAALLDNPQLKKQMQDTATESVKKFSWSNVFEQLMQMYLQILR